MGLTDFLGTLSFAVGFSAFLMSCVLLSMYDSTTQPAPGILDSALNQSIGGKGSCRKLTEDEQKFLTSSLKELHHKVISHCQGIAAAYSIAIIASILHIIAFILLSVMGNPKIWAILNVVLFILYLLGFILNVYFSNHTMADSLLDETSNRNDNPKPYLLFFNIPFLEKNLYAFGQAGVGLAAICFVAVIVTLTCAILSFLGK